MKRRLFRSRSRAAMISLLALAVLATGAGLALGQSGELVVVLPGGTLEKVLRKSWVEPFEKKNNAKATVVTGLTMENLAKLRAQKGNPQIDVVIFECHAASSPDMRRGSRRSRALASVSF